MDQYEKLLHHNIEKQQTLTDIKNTSHSLDATEDLIKDKIKIKEAELIALKNDYKNMIDKFNHIIDVLIK